MPGFSNCEGAEALQRAWGLQRLRLGASDCEGAWGCSWGCSDCGSSWGGSEAAATAAARLGLQLASVVAASSCRRRLVADLQRLWAPHSRCSPRCPSQSLQVPVRCSPQVPFTVASAPQPHGPPCSSSRDPRGWVRIAVEATTTRRSDDEAQRRRCGDDDATTRRRRTRGDNDRARMVPSKCCHRNVATEMSLASRAEAGHDDAATTRRGDDNSLAPAAAPTCPDSRCSPQVPQPRCSAQASLPPLTPDPRGWVRIAV